MPTHSIKLRYKWSHARSTNLIIVVPVGSGVEVKEGLVDITLQLKGSLHSFEGTLPVVLGWLLEVTENDFAATLDLEAHELFSMLLLLVTRLLEELAKAGESHIPPVKVVGLWNKGKMVLKH